MNKQYEEVILDELHSTAFMGTGLGRTILGPDENIKNLTRDDLQSYIKTHYTANRYVNYKQFLIVEEAIIRNYKHFFIFVRFVIAAAGAVDHSQLVDLTQQHFGGLSATSADPLFKFEPAVFTGSDKRIRYDSMGVRNTSHTYILLSLNSIYVIVP